MSRNEVTDLLLDELEKYGITGSVEERGKHLAIVWQIGGRIRQLFTSKTPSDWRTGMNSRSEMRRLLREDNAKLLEPTAFNKAMSLPQPVRVSPAEREVLKNKDIDALIEMVFDLQSQLSRLENRLAGATVVSRIEFAAPPHISVPVSEPQQVTLQEIPEAAPVQETSDLVKAPWEQRWTPRHGSQQYNILGVFTREKPLSLDMISDLTGQNKKYVSATIHKLSKAGLIESPHRGWWRRA